MGRTDPRKDLIVEE
jgi:hypothetical protein